MWYTLTDSWHYINMMHTYSRYQNKYDACLLTNDMKLIWFIITVDINLIWCILTHSWYQIISVHTTVTLDTKIIWCILIHSWHEFNIMHTYWQLISHKYGPYYSNTWHQIKWRILTCSWHQINLLVSVRYIYFMSTVSMHHIISCQLQ